MTYTKYAADEKWAIQDIAFAVIKVFNVPEVALRSTSRKREVADARKVVCLLASLIIPTRRDHTGKVNTAAASCYLRRDHGTVYASIIAAKQLIETDKLFRNAVDYAMMIVKNCVPEGFVPELRNYNPPKPKKDPTYIARSGRASSGVRYELKEASLSINEFMKIKRLYSGGVAIEEMVRRTGFSTLFIRYLAVKHEWVRDVKPMYPDRTHLMRQGNTISGHGLKRKGELK